MIPILFPADEITKGPNAFTTNGLGRLNDATKCVVTEVIKGSYELELTYPIYGVHYNLIKHGCYIFSKPSEGANPQPFEIYRIGIPLDGLVKIYAWHISYKLSYIPVDPFEAIGPQDMILKMNSHAIGDNPFTVTTDISDQESASIPIETYEPFSYRELIGGVDGNFIETFNAEPEFDIFNVKLNSHRGYDNGVRILYGKNLTDMDYEQNEDNYVTHYYPYWTNDEGIYLTGDIVKSPWIEEDLDTWEKKRIVPFDTSPYLEAEEDPDTGVIDYPTADEIESCAILYMLENGIGLKNESITISFEQLWNTEEYKNIAPVERVRLGDTVNVYNRQAGLDFTTRVVKTVYDSLLERYTSIDLGDHKNNLETTILDFQNGNKEAISKAVDRAYLELGKRITDLDESTSERMDGIDEDIDDAYEEISESEQRSSEAIAASEQRSSQRILDLDESLKRKMATDIAASAADLTAQMNAALIAQMNLINGATGGYVVTITDASGKPQETIYGDAPTLSEMVNCLRINYAGIGFSQNGYQGPYTTAWDINGNFNADFIRAGNINANLITAGNINASLITTGVLNADLIKTGSLAVVDDDENVIFEVNLDSKEVIINASYVRMSSTTTVTDVINELQDGTANALSISTSANDKANSLESSISEINSEIGYIHENGVSKVITTTGTFDDQGLTISQSDAPTKSNYGVDGVKIMRNNTDETVLLSVDHTGVNAENVSVRTYLNIGQRYRFENIGTDRMGCFYIGG